MQRKISTKRISEEIRFNVPAKIYLKDQEPSNLGLQATLNGTISTDATTLMKTINDHLCLRCLRRPCRPGLPWQQQAATPAGSVLLGRLKSLFSG